jgi:hypothetical protein
MVNKQDSGGIGRLEMEVGHCCQEVLVGADNEAY